MGEKSRPQTSFGSVSLCGAFCEPRKKYVEVRKLQSTFACRACLGLMFIDDWADFVQPQLFGDDNDAVGQWVNGGYDSPRCVGECAPGDIGRNKLRYAVLPGTADLR